MAHHVATASIINVREKQRAVVHPIEGSLGDPLHKDPNQSESVTL